MSGLSDHIAPFVEAGIFTPLNVRFAESLARIVPDQQDDVLLGAAVASAAISRGDICAELSRLAETLRPIAEDAPLDIGELPWPDVDSWVEALAASALVSDGSERAPLVLDGERLYLHRYWSYQQRLASALMGRAAQTFELDEVAVAARLDRLFPGGDADGDGLQRRAARTALRRHLTIISGGPGTGKTSTVVRILAALLDLQPQLRVALMAPTGKAAARMNESIREARNDEHRLDIDQAVRERIPEDASTIHRALGYQPQNTTRFRHDADNPLLADVVVVDEASMVDLAMMTKLMEATRPEARLILLGDKDQLASVAAGRVLGDICLAAAEGPLAPCLVVLEKSHRFAADSGIAGLAAAINEGDADETLALLTGDHADVRLVEADEATLSRLAADGFASRFDGERTADPRAALMAQRGFQVLCAHRRGPWGSETQNNNIAEALAQRGLLPPGERAWYPGLPLVVSKNDAPLGLFNGDVGVTLEDADGQLRVYFPQAADAQLRSFTPGQLPPHEPFYATTIHKSQGSGFDNVVVVLAERPTPVLTRELLYTAVTRARQTVTIIATPEIVRHTVETRVIRASGLRDALS